jgi:hypothetical protein
MERKRNVYRLLVGKPEGKRPVGRPRHRCVDIIKMDLVEVGWADVDWIGLAQDRDRWRALARKLGGRVSERQYSVGEGVIEINICSFEGSQAVSASPSGRGEACIRDLFSFDF